MVVLKIFVLLPIIRLSFNDTIRFQVEDSTADQYPIDTSQFTRKLNRKSFQQILILQKIY